MIIALVLIDISHFSPIQALILTALSIVIWVRYTISLIQLTQIDPTLLILELNRILLRAITTFSCSTLATLINTLACNVY